MWRTVFIKILTLLRQTSSSSQIIYVWLWPNPQVHDWMFRFKRTGSINSERRGGCNYYSCCVICNMQADCLLGLRDKALIGRPHRLLTWCLYGCGRAEPVRKRLVFNSRWKANQSTTETLDLTSKHFEVHTQVKIQIMKHNWQVLKKRIENCFFVSSWII